MLIKFSITNFLSFNDKQCFSMEAGKARKNSKRIYRNKNIKLTKCEVIFGANASGKSNLVEAFQFVQDMVVDGLPRGFTNKYFRQIPTNQSIPSSFKIELLLDNKHIVYEFSVLLKTGSIEEEHLYELTTSNQEKSIFYRNLKSSIFEAGDYFKNKNAVEKLNMYGEDSIADSELLFLSIINHGKEKMYEDNPELKILRKVYIWFNNLLTVSNPDSILTGYPYFSSSNLNEIANLLNALGTGISDLKIVEVPVDIIKSKVPEELFNKVVADLEKKSAKKGRHHSPSIMLRSYKEFYTFELNDNDDLIIKTIEFSHESKSVYFNLKEESDGTARLLDLIEILLKVSDNRVFVIDEIDRCLHPAMTTRMIELFLKMAEQRNTQLIITSHESRLLATEILRNDEVCFVIKNEKGESILNPLEKYQLRADKKVYSAMFDGTLSDVLPNYNEEKMEFILKKDRS